MGQMDDMERSHLIIDKDTNKVYDVRKEMDMARLERQTSSSSTIEDDQSKKQNQVLGSEASPSEKPKRAKAKPWANLWKEKR